MLHFQLDEKLDGDHWTERYQSDFFNVVEVVQTPTQIKDEM